MFASFFRQTMDALAYRMQMHVHLGLFRDPALETVWLDYLYASNNLKKSLSLCFIFV